MRRRIQAISLAALAAALCSTPAEAPASEGEAVHTVWPAAATSAVAPESSTAWRGRYCTTARCRGRRAAPAAHLVGFGGAVVASFWLRRRLNGTPP